MHSTQNSSSIFFISFFVFCCFFTITDGFNPTKEVKELWQKNVPSNLQNMKRQVDGECFDHFICGPQNSACIPDPEDDTPCEACQVNLNQCTLVLPICVCFEEYFQCLFNSSTPACDSYIENAVTLCTSFCSEDVCGNRTRDPIEINLCTFGSYCEQDNLQCKSIIPLGSECNPQQTTDPLLASQCQSSLSFDEAKVGCNNDSSTCEWILPFAEAGDNCTGTLECLSGDCQFEVCVGPTEGESCTSQCAFGYFCNSTDVCQATKNESEACNSDMECSPFLVCGAEGACVRPFTKGLGEDCVTPFECIGGLGCSATTHVCEDLLVRNPCNTTDDCLGNSTCECDRWSSTGGKVCTPTDDFFEVMFTEECVAKLTNLVECAAENECITIFSDRESSCVYNHCRDLLNCAMDCLTTAFTASPSYPSECFEFPQYPCASTTTQDTGDTDTSNSSGSSTHTNSENTVTSTQTTSPTDPSGSQTDTTDENVSSLVTYSLILSVSGVVSFFL